MRCGEVCHQVGATMSPCPVVAMSSEGRGRPRLEQSRRPGKTAREEILDAAAELFTIAGLRQHVDAAHRRRRRDPAGVAVSPLRHQGRHPRRPAGRDRRRRRCAWPRNCWPTAGRPRRACTCWWPPTSTSCAPAGGTSAGCTCCRNCGCRGSSSSTWARAELRAHYATLPQQVIAECDGPPAAVDLPFRLVESVINGRSDDGAARRIRRWVIAGRGIADPWLARRLRGAPAGER